MLYDEINDLIERYPDTYTFLTIGNVVEVENKLIDRGRWAVINRVVFKRGNQYVAVEYQEGATEYQDCEPEAVAYKVIPIVRSSFEYVRAE